MSTQQDIYVAGSENRPPMLNKENYVPWSSRLLRYAKSRPNGKLIYNSIMNGPYVRRMIPEPGDPARTVPVPETFHEQTDDELTEAEIKQMEADDQAIQTILLGLPEDIYAAVDSCETAQKIWLRVQQMMKGSDIGIQEKKVKLFNEWERFTSTDGESIESYYHRFSKLMNDFKRNKHFPEKINSNLITTQEFSSNAKPILLLSQLYGEIFRLNYNQLYDFLKYNQKEVDELRAERLAKSQDPLALMANSNNSFKYPNGGNQVVQNAVQNPGVQNVGNQNEVIVISGIAHQNGNGNVVATRAKGNANGNNGNQIRCYNCRGVGHLARNCTVRPRRRDVAYLQTQLLIAQKEDA
ncbi:ribonuclease H-like domain-containing protein [Tanacetum coccineum]